MNPPAAKRPCVRPTPALDDDDDDVLAQLDVSTFAQSQGDVAMSSLTGTMCAGVPSATPPRAVHSVQQVADLRPGARLDVNLDAIQSSSNYEKPALLERTLQDRERVLQ